MAKKSEQITPKSENFKEREKIILMDRENIELKHKYKMEELEFERESARLFHEKELEKIRIKSAEIRRSQQRATDFDYMTKYPKENEKK